MDSLQTLPTDQITPTPEDQTLLNSLFAPAGPAGPAGPANAAASAAPVNAVITSNAVDRIVSELREPLFAAALFALMSNDSVTELIKSVLPLARNSPGNLLLVKLVLVTIIWLLYRASRRST